MHEQQRDDVIPGIIAEFSQVFAAARTRWARFAEEVHPDLRGPGIMILQTILRHGALTVTGLGSMLDMDKAMVSRQVTKLRSLGLVDAKEADSDRRVTLLTASESARLAIERMQAQTADEYRARFADWDDSDLLQLQGMLRRFNAAVEDQPADGPAKRCAREESAG